eukprot:1609984-Pyramimonas_sp.AAC.1
MAAPLIFRSSSAVSSTGQAAPCGTRAPASGAVAGAAAAAPAGCAGASVSARGLSVGADPAASPRLSEEGTPCGGAPPPLGFRPV